MNTQEKLLLEKEIEAALDLPDVLVTVGSKYITVRDVTTDRKFQSSLENFLAPNWREGFALQVLHQLNVS